MNRLRQWIVLHPQQFSLIAWATAVLIALMLVISQAHAQTVPTVNVQPSTGPVPGTPFTAFDDYGMFSVPTGAKFKVYFGVAIDDPMKPTWVQFKRARREGGTPFMSPYIQKSNWVACTPASEFCGGFEDALPRAGHYHYEARLCTLPDPTTCSTWSSTLDFNVARVGDVKRAWWVYGYLAPAGPPQL